MAKKYIIEIDNPEWFIRREDFSYHKINRYKKFDKGLKLACPTNFARVNFLEGEPIYMFDINFFYEEELEQLAKNDFTKKEYDFIAVNDVEKTPLGEFTGTFIDAFKFINKHKHIMGYK